MSLWKVFMKNPTKLGMFLVAGLFAVGVHSEPLNFDVGYSKLHYTEDGGISFNTENVKFALSRNNFEAMASVNVRSSKEQVNGSYLESSIPYILGVFYKPEINLGSGIDLFARVGLTHLSRQFKGPNVTGGKYSDTTNGLGYGLGMSMLSTYKSKVTLDYTSYYNRGGIAVNGLSLTHTFLLP
jgi:hypothetical protein